MTDNSYKLHEWVLCFVLATTMLWLAACSNQDKPSAHDETPLTETISSGPIELTIIAEPARVHLDRDILLTLRVCAAANIEVQLPPLSGRLKGFVLSGEFTRDAPSDAGKTVREYCFRLTPTLAAEYRLAPMAITWIDRAQEPHSEGWFMSRPIIFLSVGIVKGQPGATIHDISAPLWIYPPFKTVALWAFAVISAAGALYLLWLMSRRIQRAIKLRRMSPRERALYKLNELLAHDLIGKGKIKEFYLELTGIVRRYIEEAHAIRAPEQTTEEFLIAVTHNPDFKREVVGKLRIFLQTADLVKFAAYRPERKIIDQTLATARDYIDTDESVQETLKLET